MQPSPKAETSKPLFPSFRFCIASPLESFPHAKIKINPSASGSPILPIYCLFLSAGEKVLPNPQLGAYPEPARRKPSCSQNSIETRFHRHSELLNCAGNWRASLPFLLALER